MAKPLQLALVAMGGVLTVYAQAVAALGVGEPRYLSHLFEPLRIDIPVQLARNVHENPAVRLSFVNATENHAAQADNNLRSEWLVDSRGDHILRIWANKPVNEPMLNLRVELADGGVQVQRDLTLLFDPAPIDPSPEAMIAAEPASADPSVAAVDVPATQPAPVESAAAPLASIDADARPASQSVPEARTQAEPRPVMTAAATTPVNTVAREPAVASAPAAVAEPVEVDRAAQIASTHSALALGAADRWQRILVADGETLDQLAVRVRGDHDLPLPMVAMLLRWLNPRSFEGAVGKPLPGAMLRFPKPESLAAQMAVSGGRWTTDPAEPAQAALPSPVSASRSRPAQPDDRLAMAMASASVLAGMPTALASTSPLMAPTSPAGIARMSGGMTIGAMLVTVLSTILMLKMIAGTPAPVAQRYLAGQVLSRSERPASRPAARVLPPRTFTVPLNIRSKGASASDDPVELLQTHAAARQARRATQDPPA